MTQHLNHQLGKKSKEEGIYVCVWLIYFAVEQKLTQHSKATILQTNQNKTKILQLKASHNKMEEKGVPGWTVKKTFPYKNITDMLDKII